MLNRDTIGMFSLCRWAFFVVSSQPISRVISMIADIRFRRPGDIRLNHVLWPNRPVVCSSAPDILTTNKKNIPKKMQLVSGTRLVKYFNWKYVFSLKQIWTLSGRSLHLFQLKRQRRSLVHLMARLIWRADGHHTRHSATTSSIRLCAVCTSVFMTHSGRSNSEFNCPNTTVSIAFSTIKPCKWNGRETHRRKWTTRCTSSCLEIAILTGIRS